MNLAEAEKICVEIQRQVFEKVHHNKKINSFAPDAKSERIHRKDGGLLINDISYESQYPNGYMDLWYPQGEILEKKPVFIYFHGGGFLFGDKSSGDPLAAEGHEPAGIIGRILREGFCVVNANYAFAPEYRFPVQIVQVNELMDFLRKHEEEYGLDMNRIVLGGSSAGANMTAIYGTMIANPNYAEKLGIRPAISRKRIKALMIDEAALDLTKVDQNLILLVQPWLGEDDPVASETGRLINAARWITEDMIPSYVIASNLEDNFAPFGEELDAVLKEKGVTHEYFYRSREVDRLEHGFMSRFQENRSARDCLEGMLEFVRKCIVQEA